MVSEGVKKRVLWWGRFDPGYSRNRVYISLFRKLGWEVDFFFVRISPRFGDVEAFSRRLSSKPKPDLVWVRSPDSAISPRPAAGRTGAGFRSFSIR